MEGLRIKLKERFYWPGHYADVQNWCQTCSQCAQGKILQGAKKNSELRCVQFLCAEYALFWGSGGLVPGKFLKISCLRLNLLVILAKSLLEMYCFNE